MTDSGSVVEVRTSSSNASEIVVLRGDEARGFVKKFGRMFKHKTPGSGTPIPDRAVISIRISPGTEPAEGTESLVEIVTAIPMRVPSSAADVANAVRVREFRQRLIDRGAFTIGDLAQGRSSTLGAARKWMERREKDGRLFTVKVDGRVLVPASLLDGAFDPIEAWVPVLGSLREAGESEWGLWAWIDGPQSLLSGDAPSNVIGKDPERVIRAAERFGQQAQR